MTKRFGFTLAEVLITLGIIGVVAAMTMPTLINQTNGAQYKAAFKKGMSAFSQAVTLNVALDDENFETVDLTQTGAVTGDAIATIVTKRMNVAATTKPDDYTLESGMDSYIATTDGIVLQYAKSDKCTDATRTDGQVTAQGTACLGYLDVNGSKGPNAVIGSKNDQVTDLYPVFIEAQGLVPASEAARSVLFDAKTLGSKDIIGGASTSD